MVNLLCLHPINKTQMTTHLFTHGVLNILSPLLRSTAQKGKKNLFKLLPLIDNAPGHPSARMEVYNRISVVFMLAIATSILQSMDQGVILTFIYYY